MPIAYQWHPITDLPVDAASLTEGELEALGRVWKTQRGQLVETASLNEFDRRLRREWAIETGIIEDVYTLDRGVTRTLIEKGIDASLIPHDATNRDTLLVARIIQDHYETLEGMFDFVGGQRSLSTGYVRDVYAALLRNVDTYTGVDDLGRAHEITLEKGEYKRMPNSPTRPDGTVHEYCPPVHVAAEMDRLMAMHAGHGAPPEVEAAWLHHRFTQIHPFQDGNGRVARALASLIFVKAGWFPLIIKRDDKQRYIEALESADRDDLRPLVALFVEAQRNALIEATEIVFEIHPPSTPEEAIAGVRDRLLQRGRLALKEWLEAKEVARKLLSHAIQRFGTVSVTLQQEIGSVGRGFQFGGSGGERGGFDEQLSKVLLQAGHVADFGEFNAVAELRLNSGRNEMLVVSFHGIGPRFRGLIGVVAYLAIPGTEPALIRGGTFQINYEEEYPKAEARFSSWLDRVITLALARWRLTL